MAAWIRVQGVLDRPLHIAACYVPPGLPAAGLGQFFGHLCRDVLRAREAGYVAVGGDFNGRTGAAVEGDVGDGELSASILPHIGERISVDTTLNAQGRALLGMCQEGGLWIANGRLPGDIPGQWTYHSIQNAGAALVVDYFLLDADLLGVAGATLNVQPPEQCLDHTAIVLTLGEGACLPADTSASGAGPSPAGAEYIVDPSLCLPSRRRSRPGGRRGKGSRHSKLQQLRCGGYTPTLLEHNHTAEFVAARPPLAGRRPGRPAACAAWPARI